MKNKISIKSNIIDDYKIIQNKQDKVSSMLMNNIYNLSDLDKVILKRIIKLYIENNLFNFRIEDIAKECHVSNSKITKVLQKCGFSGYKDFKLTVLYSIDVKKGKNQTINYLNETFIASLYKTCENISVSDFDIFNKFVNKANAIYFISGGLNNSLCSIFSEKFNRIGKKSKSIEVSNSECNNIYDNSLVIVVSLSGKNYKIKNRIEQIKKNVKNVKIISITFSNKSNIFDISDKEYHLSFIDHEGLNERELPRHSFSIISIFLDMFFLEFYKTKREDFEKMIETNADKIIL